MRVANFVLLFSLPSQLAAAALRSYPEAVLHQDPTSLMQTTHTHAVVSVTAEGDVLDGYGTPLSLNDEDEDGKEANVLISNEGFKLQNSEIVEIHVTPHDVATSSLMQTTYTHAVVSVAPDGEVYDEEDGMPLSLNEDDEEENAESSGVEVIVSPHNSLVETQEKEQKSLLQSTIVFTSDGKLNREQVTSNASDDEIVVSAAGMVSGDDISETNESELQSDIIEMPQTTADSSLIQTTVSVRSDGDVMLNYGIVLAYGDEGDDTDEISHDSLQVEEKFLEGDVLL